MALKKQEKTAAKPIEKKQEKKPVAAGSFTAKPAEKKKKW